VTIETPGELRIELVAMRPGARSGGNTVRFPSISRATAINLKDLLAFSQGHVALGKRMCRRSGPPWRRHGDEQQRQAAAKLAGRAR